MAAVVVKGNHGIELRLEEPSLRRLIDAAPLDAEALADACLGRDRRSAAELDTDNLLFVADWCLRKVARDPEVKTLARICAAFACRPSEYLRITDPVLAFDFDAMFVTSEKEAAADAVPRDPDPWKPGDEDD